MAGATLHFNVASWSLLGGATERRSLDNKEKFTPSCLFMKLSGGFLLTDSSKGANQHFFTPAEAVPSHSSSIQFAVLPTLGESASLYAPPPPPHRHQYQLDTSSGYSGTMDVFGDIGDISSESADDNQPPIPGQPVDECGLPQDQQGEKPISETTIEVEIPSINRDLGNELFFVKLPKFLIIEPKPFDPQYYEDEFENKKVLDEEDRTRLKLKVENTIRWRIRRDEEGNKIKESNARVIKWSDGSLSLHVGSEVFDVYKGPVQGNHLQLFVREDTGLQGQAVFKSKLTFRPHSVGCATHRKMTLPLANRGSGTQKIRILPIAGCDPECQHTEKIKKEHKRVRSSHQRTTVCLQNKQNQQGPRDPSSDEEEEGDEAIENQYHGELGEEQARIYSSDSDEESEENKSQRLPRAKQLSSDEENPPEIGKQGVKRKTMTEA